MKSSTIIILLLILRSPVFGQGLSEAVRSGGYVSSFNTSQGNNITELKNDITPVCLSDWTVASLQKKNHPVLWYVGVGLVLGGTGTILGMGIVDYASGGYANGVLLVSAETAKTYAIIELSGIGALGAGLGVLFINKKYQKKHPQRFTVINTRDHAGFAYNF